MTNVVKHFKWEPKGRRRLHKKPNSSEIKACIPWLEAEIELVKPKVLILLGATAAQAMMGKDFKVTERRGELLESRWGRPALATVHPSSILRQRTSEDRQRERDLFVEDLRKVAQLLATGHPR